jgi:hypothetical protein
LSRLRVVMFPYPMFPPPRCVSVLKMQLVTSAGLFRIDHFSKAARRDGKGLVPKTDNDQNRPL